MDAAASAVAAGDSWRDFLGIALLPALGDLVRTPRGAVLRMMVGEAGRFPKLAEVYYRRKRRLPPQEGSRPLVHPPRTIEDFGVDTGRLSHGSRARRKRTLAAKKIPTPQTNSAHLWFSFL